MSTHTEDTKELQHCSGCTDDHSEGTHQMHTIEHPCKEGGDPDCGYCFPRDTKEMTVEKILKDIDFWKSQERNGHSFEEMSQAVEALKESVRTTLTTYASQVREKWLQEEIVRLEGMKKETSMTYTHQCPSDCCVMGSDHTHEETVTIPSAVVYNQAIQTIIDRYQSELTTLTQKT